MNGPAHQGRSLLVVPAFNEAARLGQVLRWVNAAALACEVVVVDDGSVDRTAAIARQANATVLRHPSNLGYGAALQTGYKYAWQRGAWLVAQMDADGQHDPNQLAPLIERVRGGFADLVIGSRFLGESSYRMGRARSLGRNLLRAAARAAGRRITDPTSGFQAMNRRVLELYVGDFFPTDYPDLDVLLVACRRGLRVEECPVTMSASPRRSRLHSGWTPVYYLYRMALALWIGAPAAAPENALPRQRSWEAR